MARTYTGSEIVAKVLQATKLIEEGTLPSKVWNEVHITRQTYRRWKEICDSIYSDFTAQADNTSRKLKSTKSKVQRLEEQLKTANVKLKHARNQVRNLENQHKEAALKPCNASGKQSQSCKAKRETATSDKNMQRLQGKL